MRLHCSLSANSGLMHRCKQHRYSITSSARPSSEGATVRPGTGAVLRLMHSYFAFATIPSTLRTNSIPISSLHLAYTARVLLRNDSISAVEG